MPTCLKNRTAVIVHIVSVRMKTIWFVAFLATSLQAQNVFLLGSNTTPPPDLNGNDAPAPAVATAPGGVTVNVYVNNGGSAACTYPTYDPYYPGGYNTYYPQYSSPNVMYIGGPGTCGPIYYNYYPQNSGV